MEELPGHGGPVRSLWTELAIGSVLALLCLSVPPLDRVLRCLLITIHEAGHAALGWAYGYPSLPAFDLRYGGGVTRHDARSWLLLAAAYALGIALLRAAADRPARTRHVVFAALAFFVVTAHTPLHHALRIAAGHGAELVVAGVFLYRALSGVAIAHELERPLYACVGLWMLLADLGFGWDLLTSPAARLRYQQAKGGGHWMDFSRLAEEWLHVPLEVVAAIFLAACLAVPLAVWWIDRQLADGR